MRRILQALVAGVMLATPALAQGAAPVCGGNDLLAQLRVKDPEAFKNYEVEAARVPNGQGLFWRIDKAGVESSYLFGTVHLTDPRLTDLPPQVSTALSESRTVALELAATGDPERMAKLGERMIAMAMNTTGEPALTSLTEEERRKVAQALIARGLPAEAMQMLKPWFLTVSLALPPCEISRQRAALRNVDEVVAAQARQRKIPVVGLEKDAEQLEVLASLEPWVYEATLRDSSRSEARNQDMLELLVQMYLDRNPGGVIPAYRQLALPQDNMKAFAIFMKALMGSRNEVMRDRALPLLQKGAVFIAVGALHLPGETGLIELLRERGFTLTRVL